MVIPGVTTRKVSENRLSFGLAILFKACQAMSMAMTTVLPEPVAIFIKSKSTASGGETPKGSAVSGVNVRRSSVRKAPRGRRTAMKEWQSQAHVKWDCKYHVVILPKYRRKVLYGRIRRGIGQILRDLCRQKDIELVEGKAMPDHIHMLLSVPPRYSVAMAIGYLKGKSATRIHR